MAESPTTARFRDSLALLPSGVTVLTTDGPGGLAGMTASAVCSVTDDPPTVLACVNRSSYAHRFFDENRAICVNILGADQQALAALFSDRTVTMGERFERAAHAPLVTGAPALADALAAMDGEIAHVHEVGTHSLLIIAVKAIRLREAGAPAGLAYFNRNYHPLFAA